MRKRTKAREMALKILYAWEITAEPLEECRRKHRENITGEDDSIVEFAGKLITGIEANMAEIDAIITKHATNWSLERMAKIDRNVLRIASYELLFMPQTPPKVAINEAIDLVKKYGDKDSGKFVNGILDNIRKNETQHE